MTTAKDEIGSFITATRFGGRRKIRTDRKSARPESLDDARKIINAAFDENEWDEDERRRYFNLIGVGGIDTADDCLTVLDDLENNRMVLFQ